VTRRLYLLRHAKSSWDDPSLADRDRPLAPRGRRACRTIAAYVREQRIEPGLVLCSPATRARQTLDGVAAGFAKQPRIEIDEALYAGDLLAALRRVADDVESVMLVGHDPSIKELLELLAGEALADKFPTAALATLELRGGWSELGPAAASLVALVRPRELEKNGR
jgi:phosphohistidine phosphatase